MTYYTKYHKSQTFKVGTELANEITDQIEDIWLNKKEMKDLRAEGFTSSIFLDSALYLYLGKFFSREDLHQLLDDALNGLDNNLGEEQ